MRDGESSSHLPLPLPSTVLPFADQSLASFRCDCYNSATAGSILLCLSFLTSFVFGFKDAKLKDPSQVGDD